MSNTPEDTALENKLGELYFSTDDIGHFRQLDNQEISSIMNLITLHTQKVIENDRTIRDPKVRLWTLNFVYSPTNQMFTQKNVEEYIAQLTNPTERSE